MGWQDYIALAVVAAAVLYLLRGLFRKSAPAAPCGSACGGCPAPTTSEPKLVTLNTDVKPL